jgi:hypothetical protein
MSEQRSTDEGRDQPARLRDTAGPSGRVLAAFDAQTKLTDRDEDRAWRHLRQQLRAEHAPTARQGKVHRWLAVAGAMAGLIIAVALTAGQHRRLPQERTAVVAPESARAKPISVDDSAAAPAIAPAIAATAAPLPSLELSGVPRSLPDQGVRLDEHIAVIAAPGTKATAWVDRAGQQHVDLASGTVELIVSGGVHPVLVVHAGEYRFRDRGTVFTVGRTATAVWLHVKSGAVGVSKARQMLAVIRANHRWSAGVAGTASNMPARPSPSRASASAASTSGPLAVLDVPAPSALNPPGPAPAIVVPETPVAAAPPIAPRRSLPDCRALEQQERDDEAQSCLRGLAEGSDLNAETALYELARVQQKSLGDTAAALATLKKQRRRFPNGALRDEAELTTIELLPRLGQYRSALDLSDSFLARHPRHERVAELHLLRANILREVFADHAAAVREYQEIDAGAGGIADDAAFFLAVSLESDGRKQEAADAYRRYLKRGAPAHVAVARARLAALAR